MTVSVVTPACNVAARLPRCLDSLRAQTHADLQVVLVDDGSTDATARLCDEAAARDGRVTAIHQDNGGPAAARNAGLDAASGEWLMFVDADDTIAPDYVERMLAVARETGAELVASDCTIAEGGRERRFGMVVPDMYYERRDDLFQDFLSGRMPWSLWAKLYRAELFDGVRFDERDYIAEDLDANARIFAREGLRLATTGGSGYRYEVVDGSVDHSFTERHLRQFDVFERVVRLVRESGIQTETAPEVFYEERVLNCLRKAIAADALTPQVKRAFSDAIARHRRDVLRDAQASPQLKLRMRASRLGVGAYARLSRLFG